MLLKIGHPGADGDTGAGPARLGALIFNDTLVYESDADGESESDGSWLVSPGSVTAADYQLEYPVPPSGITGVTGLRLDAMPPPASPQAARASKRRAASS